MAPLQNDDLTFMLSAEHVYLYVDILSDDQTPLIFDSIKRKWLVSISAFLETIRIEQGFSHFSFMQNMQQNHIWPFIFIKWIKYGSIYLVKISTNENRGKEEKM